MYGAIHSLSKHVLGTVLLEAEKAKSFSCSPEGAHSSKIGGEAEELFLKGKNEETDIHTLTFLD